MTKVTLVTEHLILRKPKFSDVKPMFINWASDPEVTKYLTWPPHNNIEVTRNVVKRWLDEEKDPKTIRFIITIKGSDEPFGSIDVVGYHDGIPEIGYCLAKKHWGKGYMTEACKALINYLFDKGFNKVLICAETENIGSNRVIEKCGFKFVETVHREEASPFKQYPIDLNYYEIEK